MYLDPYDRDYSQKPAKASQNIREKKPCKHLMVLTWGLERNASSLWFFERGFFSRCSAKARESGFQTMYAAKEKRYTTKVFLIFLITCWTVTSLWILSQKPFTLIIFILGPCVLPWDQFYFYLGPFGLIISQNLA